MMTIFQSFAQITSNLFHHWLLSVMDRIKAVASATISKPINLKQLLFYCRISSIVIFQKADTKLNKIGLFYMEHSFL